ncbi:hypothetical protein ISS39_05790 [Candidatus Bathyarchaeota archaeon]|nr:hypothetical protein [Candidatus Bathyarchaeota archaeon]
MSCLEQENIIDETLFINNTMDDVYSQCKSWLLKNDAKIKNEKKPDYIKALHEIRHVAGEFMSPSGKSLVGPKTHWSKNIEIRLSETMDGTQIRVMLNPSYKQEPWHDFSDRRKIWLSFVGGLARHLKIQLTKSDLEYYYQKEYFQNEIHYYTMGLIGSIFAILITFLIVDPSSMTAKDGIVLLFWLWMGYNSLSNGRSLYDLREEKRFVYGP